MEATAAIGAEIGVHAVAEVATSNGRRMMVGHHVLAHVALVSAVYGREHGTRVGRDDVIEACDRWNEIDDPFLHLAEDAGISKVHAWLIRTAWDQFPVQEAPHGNIDIWFGMYRRALAAGVLDAGFVSLWERVFGMPLRDWYHACVALWLLLVAQGIPVEAFDLPPGSPPVAGINPAFSVGELRRRSDQLGAGLVNLEGAVADLSQGLEDLSHSYEASRPPDPTFERYAFNPLVSRPILRADAARHVVPVPRLFGNAMSLATLYRLMAVDSTVSADVGRAFEHYVGETLRASFDDVRPEERYNVGKDEWRGFDWIIVEDDYVLLIECRISRIPLVAKSRGDVEEIVDGLKRSVSEPASKMDAKIEHIRDGLTAIPPNVLSRRVHRLIVTLENMHLESLYVELAGYDPRNVDHPLLVSIVGLQRLLSVPGKSAHELIDEYRAAYQPNESGAIDQWLRSHADYGERIGRHPVAAEDHGLILRAPPSP